MEEKLNYLEARVNVLELLVLQDVENLKMYIKAMEQLKSAQTANFSPKSKDLFEAHLQQLSAFLAQKENT